MGSGDADQCERNLRCERGSKHHGWGGHCRLRHDRRAAAVVAAEGDWGEEGRQTGNEDINDASSGSSTGSGSNINRHSEAREKAEGHIPKAVDRGSSKPRQVAPTAEAARAVAVAAARAVAKSEARLAATPTPSATLPMSPAAIPKQAIESGAPGTGPAMQSAAVSAGPLVSPWPLQMPTNPTELEAPATVVAPSGGGSGMEAVRTMLSTTRLEQYADQFEAMGYDDLHFLRAMTEAETEQACADVGMSAKPGHVMRLKAGLRGWYKGGW